MSIILTLEFKTPPKLPFSGSIGEVEQNTYILHSTVFRKHFHDLTRYLISSDWIEEEVIIRKQDSVLSISELHSWILSLRNLEVELQTLNASMGAAPSGWGYPQLSKIKKEIPKTVQEHKDHVFWFQIGSFDKEQRWLVDKHQILAIITQEAEDKNLLLCPSFDLEKVVSIIDRLPNHIPTHQSSSWEIETEQVIEGSQINQKATGVIHKRTLNRHIQNETSHPHPSQSSNSSSGKGKRSIPETSFKDIGGIDDIITTIREVIELPLKNPGLFKHLGIKPHKGILLFGPPGCGKTMIAKGIAHDVEAHFISVKGPELINKYYGQSEENLRSLFEEASEMAPSIIFFDEIDAVAQKRSGADTSRIEAKFVNQLLTLMDGIEDYGNVCVIAATNRPELLDTALVRPGRFDYQLNVPKPDAQGCKQIFDINLKKMPVVSEFDSISFSEKLLGLTGAEIAFVAREGAYNCLRRVQTLGQYDFNSLAQLRTYDDFSIQEADFTEALNKITTDAK